MSKYSIGIDIGTNFTRAVCLQDSGPEHGLPIRIAGVGIAESKGIRHGYVTNIPEAAKSIRAALKPIDKALMGLKLPPVCISIGGVGLSGNIFQSSVSLAKNEMEVTDADVAKVSDHTKSDMPQAFALNRRVIHSFPLQYKVDGRVIPGKPHGLKGMKLESRTLFITCLAHHINDAIEAIEMAGYEIEDLTSAPIARGNLLLTKAEKIAGVVLVDIGAEALSVVVYENGLPISLEVFNAGSNEITNDIALGLKIGLPEAEEIKKSIGLGRTEYPKKKLEDIISKRLSSMFTLIEDHLRKIGKSGLLPAGVVLSGGGAEITHIEAVAKATLKLPVRRIEERTDNGNRGQMKTSEWAGAYGAAMFSMSNEDEESFGLMHGIAFGKKAGKNVWAWIKQFLP
jgi:cell division protein FtsA